MVRRYIFFYSPHLLKSFRNTLLKYDINIGERKISWDYIRQFFEKDQQQKIRLAPKLTEKHICVEGFSKMRANLAAQVMSRTVAAGIYTHSVSGTLPQKAIHTAEFVEKVDSLFDCFNSSSKTHYKSVLSAVSADSCHIAFISKIKDYILSLKVCTPPHVRIHCVDGWLINLAALEALWLHLQSYQVKYLLTRRLNQDCLENLFARLRVRFGNCDHPTAYNFLKGLKSVIINDFSHFSRTSNCEADESYFLDVTSDDREPDLPPSDTDSETEESVENMPPAEVNALVYVAGWTCKKFLKTHNCQVCRELLLDVSQQLDSNNKIFCLLKANYSKSDNTFGGLSIPNSSVIEHFKEVEGLLRPSLEKAMLGKRVSQMLLSKLNNHVFKAPLHLCSTQLTKTIHLIYIRLKIFYTVKWRNREQSRPKLRKNKKINKLSK